VQQLDTSTFIQLSYDLKCSNTTHLSEQNDKRRKQFTFKLTHFTNSCWAESVPYRLPGNSESDCLWITAGQVSYLSDCS